MKSKLEAGSWKLEAARFLMRATAMAAWPQEDLSERSFEFACDVFDYCEDLVAFGGLARRLGYQLWDSASSVGANRTESKSSYSDAEFAAKNAICLAAENIYCRNRTNSFRFT